MSIYIKFNKKEVLRTSGGMIESLYYELEEVLEKNNLNNPELTSFMLAMEFCAKNMCPYIDINDYIKSSNGINQLLIILEITITNLTPKIPEYTTKNLWGFYKELMLYKEELITKGL